jgi:hypothetical protein
MLEQFLKGELPLSTLAFKDAGAEVGRGILLTVNTPGLGVVNEFIVAPPRYPDAGSASPLIPLLLFAAAVDDEAAAERSLREWRRKGLLARQGESGPRDQNGQVESVADEPAAPFAIKQPTAVDLLELQRLIAQETSLSIISDHVTRDVIPVPAELNSEQPLWQILAVLSESRGSPARAFRWRSVGECLVFHRRQWAIWAPKEIPESLLFSCRAKLRTQGQLTLHDVTEAYRVLADLPQFEEMTLSWPDDLVRAGYAVGPYVVRETLLLYASLSPDQEGKARSSDGLAFSDLSAGQRRDLVALAAQPWMELTADEAAEILFRVVERTGQEDNSAGTESAWREFDQYEFILDVKNDPRRSGRAAIRLPRGHAGGEAR